MTYELTDWTCDEGCCIAGRDPEISRQRITANGGVRNISRPMFEVAPNWPCDTRSNEDHRYCLPSRDSYTFHPSDPRIADSDAQIIEHWFFKKLRKEIM